MSFKNLRLAIKDNGFISTNVPVLKDTVLRTALRGFLELPLLQRVNYGQNRLGTAFDGYSYLGQTDSLNQYDKDLLHSFVLSDISEKKAFPDAFQEYLKAVFPEQLTLIKTLEIEVLKWLGMSTLNPFYEEYITHMVSCNYYPELDLVANRTKSTDRLSFHNDVSLFSVFPFGLEGGFAYENDHGEKVVQEATEEMILFPGYFMELMSNGKIKALSHGVLLPENTSKERFSFAFFSIPKPNARIACNLFHGNGRAYYEHYLNQF